MGLNPTMNAIQRVAFSGDISAAAAKYGLDARLLAAVAAQETGGPGSNSGRNIVGDGGHGHGLFQIDDRFHAFARTAQAMNPAANADYAAHMLSGLLQKYGGDVRKALSAYNAGSPNARGTVTEWQDGEQLGYADSVLRHYTDLRAESQTEQSNVNALSNFALFQPLTPLATSPPPQTQSHSYRQLAGLDDNGHAKQGDPFASILDAGGDDDDS